MLPVFERQCDGFDDWRERILLAGAPIPDHDTMKKLALAQLASGGDAVSAYIQLYRSIQQNDGKQ